MNYRYDFIEFSRNQIRFSIYTCESNKLVISSPCYILLPIQQTENILTVRNILAHPYQLYHLGTEPSPLHSCDRNKLLRKDSRDYSHPFEL
jgi:hypothetical protein